MKTIACFTIGSNLRGALQVSIVKLELAIFVDDHLIVLKIQPRLLFILGLLKMLQLGNLRA